MQKGNTMILALILMPAIIGAAGLVIDWGMGTWQKTRLQGAADSAALAAAAYLPNHTVAGQKADALISTNYGEVTSKILTPNGYQYTVSLTVEIPTYFMRVFGHDTYTVSAHATALAHKSITNLRADGFPSAIINPNLNNDPSDDLIASNYGRPYIINYGPNNTMVQDWANGSTPAPPDASGGNSNGWKAWLGLCSDGTLGNAGAQDIKFDIINGWPGSMMIGDTIPMRNGNVTGPPEQGRQELLGSDPVPWNEFDPRTMGDNRRVVLVPIVHLIHSNRQDAFTAADYYAGGPWDPDNVVVDGFAPFFLLSSSEEESYAEALGLGGNRTGWMIGFFVPGIVSDHFDRGGTRPDMGLYEPPRLID